MTREAVIEIGRHEDGSYMMRLREAGASYPGMEDFSTLAVGSAFPPSGTQDEVAKYGRELKKALEAHDAIRSELQQIFGLQLPDRAHLRFAIAGYAADEFRWETICDDPAKFLAILDHCTVQRVVRAKSASDPALRTFRFPLRMSAYLSPSGVSAAGEFRAIAQPVIAARDKGLAIELVAYLGDQELLDQLQQEVGAGGLPGVQVRAIPPSALELEASLIADAPQIIHFFCHGQVTAGVQLLEFASISDTDTYEFRATKDGSIRLSADRLVGALQSIGSVWMTVLNSCSGAVSQPKLQSMARKLADNASPITIGMAEPILASDAIEFTKAFYENALAEIAGALGPIHAGGAVTIDASSAVARARARLHLLATAVNPDPDHFAKWSLPILYQREGGLKAALVDTNGEAIRKRVAAVAKALREMPADTPQDLREDVLSLLEKEPAVPVALRPDIYGNLP